MKILKIIMCTLPLRESPSLFPPIGSLSTITALKKAGYKDTSLYNIDLFRPTLNEIEKYFIEQKPDIIGLSAVTSTTYSHIKTMSSMLKEILPNSLIIMGGNLGASAQVVLEKTKVDIICTGEGEIDLLNICNSINKFGLLHNKHIYTIDGVCYLDENNNLIVNKDSDVLINDSIYDIDWSILEEKDEMKYYLEPMASVQWLLKDERINEPHRKGKNKAVMVASKGCVAKCTFCHRFTPGMRYIPIQTVMNRIDYFIENYNVGTIDFGDENFGLNPKWIKEFCEEIKKRDILWRCEARVDFTPSLEKIKMLKDSGCVCINYGIESGSDKMLKVMEKRSTVKKNIRALNNTIDGGLDTTIQIIIGMPGENSETIHETSKFIKKIVQHTSKYDPNKLSLNFAQALPGTPLYEYGRKNGIIGTSLDDEEAYLLKISGKDARDGETTNNFTKFPKLMLEYWLFFLGINARIDYIEAWGIDSYYNLLNESGAGVGKHLVDVDSISIEEVKGINSDSGYFASPARIIESNYKTNNLGLIHLIKKKNFSMIPILYPKQTYFIFSYFSIPLIVFRTIRGYGLSKAIKDFREYLVFKYIKISKNKNVINFDYQSLREYNNNNPINDNYSDDGMQKLRLGR
jgi:anaerobic magnesium-protoporphyrin IX monomethyl ester cyclase